LVLTSEPSTKNPSNPDHFFQLEESGTQSNTARHLNPIRLCANPRNSLPNGTASTSQRFQDQPILRHGQFALLAPSLSRPGLQPLPIRFHLSFQSDRGSTALSLGPLTNKSHLLTPGEETVFPIFGGIRQAPRQYLQKTGQAT
jgi:hypothetical protein